MKDKGLEICFASILAMVLLVFGSSAALAAAPQSQLFEPPSRSPLPLVSITALHAAGSDLAVDLVLFEGVPVKLVVALETVGGARVGSALLAPALPGRTTVRLSGAVERFLSDGFDYVLRLRDGNGAELAEASPFTVGLSCVAEVCRFVPELGVEVGAAVWLDDRLAAALREGDSTVTDLLAAAVTEDPGLLGAARNLSARLAVGADGSCRCRWAYSTTPAACGDPGISLGIYDRGFPEDELSARRVRRGAATLENACWTARGTGSETLRIALGAREVSVAWPQVALGSCGTCAGLVVTKASFLGGAHVVANGTSAVETRASWSVAVVADGSNVLSVSDLRTAISPAGEERNESIRDWSGTAASVEWTAEIETFLTAQAGLDRGFAAAQVGYRIRSTAAAACATPGAVSVGRFGGGHPLDEPIANPFDPNQISVVIGECRPPR